MDIGHRISSRRRELGLTQEQLAARVGVKRAVVGKWETNRSRPHYYLDKIAEVLDCSTTMLLENTGDEHATELGSLIGKGVVDYGRALQKRGCTEEEIAEGMKDLLVLTLKKLGLEDQFVVGLKKLKDKGKRHARKKGKSA